MRLKNKRKSDRNADSERNRVKRNWERVFNRNKINKNAREKEQKKVEKKISSNVAYRLIQLRRRISLRRICNGSNINIIIVYIKSCEESKTVCEKLECMCMHPRFPMYICIVSMSTCMLYVLYLYPCICTYIIYVCIRALVSVCMYLCC